MKKTLMALLATKNARKAAIDAKAQASQDATEIRGLMTELDALNEEIRSLNELLAAAPSDEQSERTDAVNNPVPGIIITQSHQNRADEPDDQEYRKAFMNLVTRQVPIPAELRDAGTSDTTVVGSVVPTVLVNRIVEKIEKSGSIYNLVNKTAYPAGVNIPTSAMKPVAVWVGEGVGSARQRKTTSSISFTYFKLRCEIGVTMEVGVMALKAFEDKFVKQVSEAMVLEIERRIISAADGTTSAKGILAEIPAAGQALTAAKPSYQVLVDAEAALPVEYEDGAVWVMTKKTFMAFYGIQDAEGQPISRTNYGITGKPERILLGRPVEIVTASAMNTFSATLQDGEVFAILFRLDDYTLNVIYDMGIQHQQDWDTEDLKTKAVMSVDGKVVDKNSLVTIAKI